KVEPEELTGNHRKNRREPFRRTFGDRQLCAPFFQDVLRVADCDQLGLPLLAMRMTGKPGSSIAMGPCRKSAEEYASAVTYVSSLSLRATSMQIPWQNPRLITTQRCM